MIFHEFTSYQSTAFQEVKKDITTIMSGHNKADDAATLRAFFNISPSQVELDIRNAVERIGEGRKGGGERLVVMGSSSAVRHRAP